MIIPSDGASMVAHARGMLAKDHRVGSSPNNYIYIKTYRAFLENLFYAYLAIITINETAF